MCAKKRSRTVAVAPPTPPTAKPGPLPLEPAGECRWVVPKGARPWMRVPGMVLADDRMLAQIRQDLALEQLANATALPGIVGQALAMPDCHQGYGLPVGGVVATELKHGVVSPGAVGYDINCLHGDARVLHAHGYTRRIADLAESWPAARVSSFDRSEGPCPTDVVGFLTKVAPVTRVTTASGRDVVATDDHPFLTPRGMVPLGELTEGDSVAVYPFEGVPYEPPPGRVLVTEADLASAYLGSANGLRQIVNRLRERELLPLRLDSPKLPYLARMLGFVQGDGTISISASGDAQLTVYAEPADLESFRRDVLALGF